MAIGATIPSNLIQRIIPLLMRQTEQLSKFVANFTDRIMQLKPKTKCSDPNIKQLKADLQRILQLINSIKRGLNSINSIVPVITNIATVAQTLKTIQLAIPAVPGVPSGPITELINTFDNLGTNARSSTSSLQGLIDSINTRLELINNTTAVGVDKLSSICNSESLNVTADIATELELLNETIDYDSIAPTKFYTELNVSNDDIQNRIQLIQNLINQQLDILQNLKEAPSKVLSDSQPPTADIGDIDDYYIDTQNQIIYGPKTESGWGNGIEI
jgi:hypothetical protein